MNGRVGGGWGWEKGKREEREGVRDGRKERGRKRGKEGGSDGWREGERDRRKKGGKEGGIRKGGSKVKVPLSC